MDYLSWRTHLPVMSAEKVQRHCASCRVKRRDGLRLWWQRRQANLDDQCLYDCPSCFVKDLQIALPEGFKDVETVQQLYKRREQLLGIKAISRKSRTRTSSPPSTRSNKDLDAHGRTSCRSNHHATPVSGFQGLHE
jgi:hypothetical protein